MHRTSLIILTTLSAFIVFIIIIVIVLTERNGRTPLFINDPSLPNASSNPPAASSNPPSQANNGPTPTVASVNLGNNRIVTVNGFPFTFQPNDKIITDTSIRIVNSSNLLTLSVCGQDASLKEPDNTSQWIIRDGVTTQISDNSIVRVENSLGFLTARLNSISECRATLTVSTNAPLNLTQFRIQKLSPDASTLSYGEPFYLIYNVNNIRTGACGPETPCGRLVTAFNNSDENIWIIRRI